MKASDHTIHHQTAAAMWGRGGSNYDDVSFILVTGVDISPELLAAAVDLSAHIRPPIEFRLGDAEQLPFDDGTFDGVISTFGVMFAIDQAAAAAELGRVCRSGGRLALTTWSPRS